MSSASQATAEAARTVLITGAGSGIGRACALRLDALGWRVVAGVRRPAEAEDLAARASKRLTTAMLDVTDDEQIASAAAMPALDGTGGLQGVVHCAGIAVAGPLEYVPIDAVRRQLEINVLGPVAVTQAMLPHLRRGRGRVVFISSMSGLVAAPFTGPYHASKFALEGLADSLRGELRPWGLHVAIVEPGVVATPIWEKSVAAADALMAAFPPPASRDYGAVADGLRRRALQSGARGASPERVVDAVLHALTVPRPRTRYLVGWDARLAALVARLPDRLRDRLLAQRLPRYGPSQGQAGP